MENYRKHYGKMIGKLYENAWKNMTCESKPNHWDVNIFSVNRVFEKLNKGFQEPGVSQKGPT